MNRQFIFRDYWWIAPLGAALGIVPVAIWAPGQKASLIGSIIAGALAFCCFAQQQKLAEMSLFKELFTEFNRRYDNLDERLRQIAISGKLSGEGDDKAIIGYFNVCGEEYLFFSEGYIHREVWRAWCAGMLWYFEREPFRGMWAIEKATNSYYGLSLDAIRRGAAC
jgi:hypothetical protein